MEQVLPADLPIQQVRKRSAPGCAPAALPVSAWAAWQLRCLTPITSSRLPPPLHTRSYKQWLQQAAQEVRAARNGPGGVQLFNLSPAWWVEGAGCGW